MTLENYLNEMKYIIFSNPNLIYVRVKNSDKKLSSVVKIIFDFVVENEIDGHYQEFFQYAGSDADPFVFTITDGYEGLLSGHIEKIANLTKCRYEVEQKEVA